MKRIFIAFAALLLGLASKAMAISDEQGSARPALWRSTMIANVPENFTLLSTGSIHLHSIIVDSPTVNIQSFVSIYNSTSPANGTLSNFNVSTAAIMYSNMTSVQINAAVSDDVQVLLNTEWPKQNIYDVNLTSGAVINKVGNATVTILWDYVDTRLAEKMRHMVPRRP